VSKSREPVTPQARKPWKKLPVIGAVAAVLFVVGALLVPLVNRTTTGRREFPEQIARVAVTSDNGRVEIVTSESGPARVEATRRYALSRPDLAAFVRGGTLSVRAACPGWAFLSCSTDLRVVVPRGTDVRVNVSGGDVRVDGVAGAVFIRSASGSVTVTNARGERIDVRTVADNIRIEAAQTPRSIEALSQAGRIDIVVPAGSYDIVAAGNDGRLRVDPRLTPNAGGPPRIGVRSETGNIVLGVRPG
jgi:Putative adhesin